MSKSERAEKLQKYREGYRELQQILDSIPRTMWNFKPEPKKWSIQEVIIHLCDTEANCYIRYRRAIAEPTKALMEFNQDVWADNLDYENQDTNLALAIFSLLRESNFKLLSDLPDETWINMVHHPEYGSQSLEDLLDTYVEHVPSHIAQIKRIHSVWKMNKIGQHA